MTGTHRIPRGSFPYHHPQGLLPDHVPSLQRTGPPNSLSGGWVKIDTAVTKLIYQGDVI
ncbi:hypothetical protein PILCRDRAFT_814000 [Piloderma croceum F 1598]|uniref:Uncharacterized protein n=1 Tax=Piloderma croceum (strain F 1598) TaxID=765440 RepID=A0A0C3GBU8_PILCF|nr:hypothetical protein PILCRDRAFT_814000 [Piloderma croceum F 1598]